MDTLRELGILWIVTGMPIGIGLWIRRRLPPGTTAGGVAVVVCGTIGIVAGWIVLDKLHEAREEAKLDHAIDGAVAGWCRAPATTDDERAIHELMCSPDAKNATLHTPDRDVSIGVVTHGDLAGLPIPRVPATGTYVVWLLDGAGAPVAHVVVTPDAGFLKLRDARIKDVRAAEVTLEPHAGAAPTTAPLAKADLR